MTNYFYKAKEHGVQWQLNRSYSLTCTPGHVAAQFNRHGNCATAKVDTVVLGKCQAACISKISVELTTFLPCSLMSEMEYNGECCGCFTAFDVKHSHSIVHVVVHCIPRGPNDIRNKSEYLTRSMAATIFLPQSLIATVTNQMLGLLYDNNSKFLTQEVEKMS